MPLDRQRSAPRPVTRREVLKAGGLALGVLSMTRPALAQTPSWTARYDSGLHDLTATVAASPRRTPAWPTRHMAVDDNGHTTTYAYDAQSRVIRSGEEITTPGHVTTMTYDSMHNQLNMSVNELGHVTTYAYDALDRQVRPALQITTPGDVTTSFYDPVGNRIGIATDNNGISTMYFYDATSRFSCTWGGCQRGAPSW
jgi:YD repeat-containing protein